MAAMKIGKGMTLVRTLGAVLAAVFAVLAAGCAPDNYGTGPAPNPPTPKGAPAPGVAVVAPMQTNV